MPTMKSPLLRFFGSLQMAVALLIAIAIVLAWGTIYETSFGTAAVQRFVYRSWWFQGLLGFLAVNLAIAAWQRYPWKRGHLPFVLAHLGIILILLGGIIGGRWGIEGQLIIPEGQSERLLQLPTNVLVIHQPNPGAHVEIPTAFETAAWVHEPKAQWRVPIAGRSIVLTVDRYYPDAVATEEIRDDHPTESPAIHLAIRHDASVDPHGGLGPEPEPGAGQEQRLWLFARDPERFGIRWGQAHLLFLEPETPAQLQQLLGQEKPSAHPRGVVSVRLAGETREREIPVPEQMDRPIALEGTAYTLTFKDYFPDFALTEEGPASRSDQPDNPAVALLLSGPEGADAHLLFALHPDFPRLHGQRHTIDAQVRYTHGAGGALPPESFAFVRRERGALALVLIGSGGQREVVDPANLNTRYRHPWMPYEVEVTDAYAHARVITHFTNRGNEVRGEALHLIAQEADATAEGWVGRGGEITLPLGAEPITVAYRPAQRELPVTIKALDFRKIDYPGTQMAAGFECDVEMTDSTRGLLLIRKISMNNPLRYRGYSFFQSSYIPGEVETTVLSVRSDPGTPLVYAGFIIIIGGVVGMFVTRSRATRSQGSRRRKGARA
ncbi:MAG TPA: hypothetical protein DDX89_05335 [Candidatus Omnitrophica bacterium]|nr:MAG: hypothetical protein A2Z92_05710 [Omnitrophica WOR_2 bacterium GWA2_63_20]OGX17789.1 MAG: hypothetical protein A2105_04830 [Omnitrophica WOR_2 bacterium GWF2_63_9]OGX31133.1 MAG: hypothetical protein A3E56_00055 [Omnitrophica WOR_2 bacterium RIFCSPHIGHO2_12_FULL_64_13]OGX35729.1 MAG: hypothetical protein A3B73_03330 [Omnitrophica WOR_2 bacterium RIFCSPHIGHO2_02_FULL_63_39]OGX45778.1 MAG: hypothetical protein A3I71_01250 [Omnitrophica WOR_2 bacterium RIFCSPLOWO2_02_FULL_63_16]OGX49380.1